MKDFKTIEHWLIPFVLVSTNAGLVQFIYFMATRAGFLPLTAISICLCLHLYGLFSKDKKILIAGLVLYWPLLWWSCVV